jgi:hypothetical protein|tara:strand:+ start:833 stop:1015 length:183 start_codon:yes stop_codon:yes gene_type:complete
MVIHDEMQGRNLLRFDGSRVGARMSADATFAKVFFCFLPLLEVVVCCCLSAEAREAFVSE